MTSALLPSGSTPWERVLADGMVPAVAIGAGIDDIVGAKLNQPTTSMLPFLIWEYGLGELTPYVPGIHELIDEGLTWQRLRGTVSAVAIGLGWVGYSAAIEEALSARRFWNSFQLRFDALPVADVPDLERIEAVTRLSVPLRSHLRRGVHHYDVVAAQGDHSVIDASYLDHESGTATTPGGTLWSFGRTTEIAYELGKAELEAAGVWIEPDWQLPIDASPAWIGVETAWTRVATPWVSGGAEAIRERAIISALTDGELFLRFYDDAGQIVGHRKCRVVRRVWSEADGEYRFAGTTYGCQDLATRIYVEALTQFGDVDEVVGDTVALVFGGTRGPDVKPGRLWLEPAELVGGHELAESPFGHGLRTTVREQVKFLLSLAAPAPP
ncbi:phage tail protein [Pelagibacterium nitratireducens]|uniref:Phage tail protein n=1 Tax=Pelagibacterium nitratireducens TaxID=1046114 RepID=A0ABZ2I2K6_9HYPH